MMWYNARYMNSSCGRTRSEETEEENRQRDRGNRRSLSAGKKEEDMAPADTGSKEDVQSKYRQSPAPSLKRNVPVENKRCRLGVLCVQCSTTRCVSGTCVVRSIGGSVCVCVPVGIENSTRITTASPRCSFLCGQL